MISLSKQSLTSKVMCISHIKDVDGCVCAALIRCATKSRFLLTNYGNIKERLRNIKSNYDIVYVCDLGINNAMLEEFRRIRRFAELTYIDHHYLNDDLFETLKEMNVNIVHNLQDCASVLTYNLFQEILPDEAGLLASYAAVSDRLENGSIAKKIIPKYDRDFILFETMLLSYALERADINLKKRIVRHLSKMEYPHKIKDVSKLALEHADKIVVLRNELPSRASRLGNIVYVEVKEGSPSVIANLLLDICDATIGICYNTNNEKQISDISIRGSNNLTLDLGKITSQLAERFEGFGGGHPRASGARIPTSRLKEFIYSFSKYL